MVEKTGCVVIIVLQMYCYYKCSVALPHGAVGCIGLQCVIVVFSDHTHLVMFWLRMVAKLYLTIIQ